MNYTLTLHWTADEPTQGSKTDQAQNRGHGGAIRKKLGACDTPKINASVEEQNWGSTKPQTNLNIKDRLKLN